MIFSFFVAVIVTPWLMLKIAGERRRPRRTTPTPMAARSAASTPPSPARSCAARRGAGLFLLVVGVAHARLAVAVLHQARHRQAAALRQQVRAVGGHRPAGRLLGRGHRRAWRRRSLAPCWRCPRCARSRPTPEPPRRSTSTASCATPTCARCPSRATSRSTSLPKGERDRASHAIALDIRQRLAGLAVPPGTSLKVVEPPPGPPVLATLLAEIYGPDPETRRAVAAQGRGRLPLGAVHRRRRQLLWRSPRGGCARPSRPTTLEFFHVEERDVFDTIAILNGGETVGYSHRGGGRQPIPIRIERPAGRPHPRRALPDHADPGQRAARRPRRGRARRRRPRRRRAAPPSRSSATTAAPAEMVTAELAGAFEAPLYGMLAVARRASTPRTGPACRSP